MIALLLALAAAAGQDSRTLVPVTLPAKQSRPEGSQPPTTMVVEPVAMAIAAFDADGDGRTSRAEMEAGVRRGFEAIAGTAPDIGYIGYSDWALRWLGDRNALPSPFEVDADANNRITLAELQAQFARTFDRLDKDHDGYLTRAELLTIRANVGEERGRGRRGGGRRQDERPAGQ